MKSIILSLLFLGISTFSISASNDLGKITGKFQSEAGEPAAFTTVVLLDKDSTVTKVDYTSDNGGFTFSGIPAGKYQLKNTSMEYQDYIGTLFDLAAGEEVDLGSITLKETVTELEEVEVRASKPLVEIQADKTVFNVSESINASSSDAMEVLRKSPGVIIDNNDNIILQGKSGVIVYIDGKQSYLSGDDLVNMLRNMTADQIESIEIITNPSAKYDAAGSAGIINIKLKRDKNLGFNATVSGQANFGLRDRYNSGINFNYRDKNSNLYGHYNYHDNEGENYEYIEKTLNGFFLDQTADNYWSHKGHNLRTGYDYFINDKHTIGAVVEANLSNNGGGSFSRTPIMDLSSNEIESVLISEGARTGETDNLKVNLNYQIDLGNESNINFDADYGYYENERTGLQPNTYYNPEEEEIIDERNFSDHQMTEVDIRTFKTDYERKALGGKLMAGVKFSNVTTDNEYQFYQLEGETKTLDIDRSSQFEYDEIVYAAYMSYYGSVSEKINYNLGVRMERTESEGVLTSEKQTDNNNVTRAYTDFFPSGGVSYKLNEKNSFSMNYSRRIDRPNYQNLNPFEYKLDELTFRRGNPFLNPQYTHNFQLNHSFNYKLNTSLTYSITKDYFAQILNTVEERGSMISEQNIADAKNLSLNVSYNTDITKWWNVFTNATLYRAEYKTDLATDMLNTEVTAYNIYLQNNFLLPADFRMEVSGWYNSPSVWGGTFESKEMYSIDMGIKRSFMDDKVAVSLSAQDVFHTQKWGGYSNYNGLEANLNGGGDTQRFKIKVDVKLGNQNVKKARNRKTGMEEEVERLN